MKFWKVAKFLLSNKEILDVFWAVYEAVKDGKVTKQEIGNISKELLDVVKTKIGGY